MSLLEKAKKIKRPNLNQQLERAELAVAWIKGEITGTQLAITIRGSEELPTKRSKDFGAYSSSLAYSLRAAYREDKLEINFKQ